MPIERLNASHNSSNLCVNRAEAVITIMSETRNIPRVVGNDVKILDENIATVLLFYKEKHRV
ncbi:MAG: hypothetical protein NVS3B14_18490 [Ktedonobacteraceae bacterium]